MNILIRNLPRFVTEREMLQMFLPFGKVRAHNLVTEPVSGKSKGFGFVDMPDRDEAVAAITALDKTTVGDQKIRVKVTAQKYEAPAKRPDRSRPVAEEHRTPSRETRKPVRRTGRGPATPYRSESRDGTGATWTRSREAAGSSRPARTPDRGSAQPARSERQSGTGATWTRSREAAGSSRPTRYPERGTAQPQQVEGNYRARPVKTEPQETTRSFRKESTADSRPKKREGNSAERPKRGGTAGTKPYKPAWRGKK